MNSAQQSRILIVDDHPTNLKVLFDLLVNYNFDVRIAKSGEKALEKIQQIAPDLILLDVIMPGMDGFETCRRLKLNHAVQDVPIIFLTALVDPIDKVKGLSLGAVDYVTKPLQHAEVIARINLHLKLRNLTRQLEEQNARLQTEVRSRQLAELALRLSEEKFAKVFRANPVPMAIVTLEEQRFVEVNQTFCEVMGYAMHDIVGRTPQDLHLWVQPQDHESFWQQLYTTRTIAPQDYPLRLQSNQIRTMLISAQVIYLGDTPCVLSVLQDVTDLKQVAASQGNR